MKQIISLSRMDLTFSLTDKYFRMFQTWVKPTEIHLTDLIVTTKVTWINLGPRLQSSGEEGFKLI